VKRLSPTQRDLLSKIAETGIGLYYSSAYRSTLEALERRGLIELTYGGQFRFGGYGHFTATLTAAGREAATGGAA
jgi:hypothetical protein